MYGIFKNLFVCLLLFGGLFGCDCINRRIIQVHKIDTLVINQGKMVDSVFIFEKSKDTFRSDRLTIYRDSNHFRYFYRERNCTTYYSKTIIQPERLREIQAKERKRPIYERLLNNLTALIGLFVILLYVFRRRS
jgi:hypothetical protein